MYGAVEPAQPTKIVCALNDHDHSIQPFRTNPWKNTHLMVADLRLCDTYFLATSELSLFVITSSTAKQRMLEPLAPVQEESFRKPAERFRKRILKVRFEKLKLVLYGNVSKKGNNSSLLHITIRIRQGEVDN